jgi:predicted RNA-binding Zn-ribbon protein involved in translation (DUF1610 family)
VSMADDFLAVHRHEMAQLEGAVERAALELGRRVRTVHERVACPRCGRAVGDRCRHVRTGAVLKHSHQERLRADGISLR